MKKLMKNERVMKLGRFLNRHMGTIMCVMMIVVMTASIASADGEAKSPEKAETLWKSMTTLIETWVTRMGGVVMFVGGVTFGLGWKSDDAEQKSRGISTLIAGAIVTAVAALAGTFFK